MSRHRPVDMENEEKTPTASVAASLGASIDLAHLEQCSDGQAARRGCYEKADINQSAESGEEVPREATRAATPSPPAASH